MDIVRICITGPESTGKSELTKALSSHYGWPFVNEYAREYLNRQDGHYTFSDLETIGKGQLQKIHQAEGQSQKPVIFLDTDLLTIWVWSDLKFHRSFDWLDQHLMPEAADLYLLCYPDLKWEPDPLREDPDQLKEIFDSYQSRLTQMGLNYQTVRGHREERLKCAVQHINRFLSI